jgi:hypothetical protein
LIICGWGENGSLSSVANFSQGVQALAIEQNKFQNCGTDTITVELERYEILY